MIQKIKFYIKIKFVLIFLFISNITNAKELFPTVKSNYDQKLETNYQTILTNFRSLKYSESDHQLIHKNLDQSIAEKNLHYINSFNYLLAEYYNHKENYKSLIELYDDTINNPVYENSISYILLLNKFYHFFYLHDINIECNRILQKIRSIAPNLEDKEEIYAESIAEYLVGLKIKGNTIDVKQKNITRSIQNLEIIQKYFDETEFNLQLAYRYNHLAIFFINVDNNHALNLFKKSLRYAENDDLRLRIILLSNINYLYNIIGKPEKGIPLGLEAEKLSIENDFKTHIFSKIICNISDSYRLIGDENTSLEYKYRCDNEALVLKTKGEQLTDNINKYLTSNERKVNKTFFGRNLIYIIGGGIFAILIVILIPLIRQRKTNSIG